MDCTNLAAGEGPLVTARRDGKNPVQEMENCRAKVQGA
ncbi:MAG: hypothetical protein KatS3mg107_0071 [Gemmataceae bacterium]|nr:MAG: hypothetical protein KatS3mg107_0071 [Gemmataceae bacterium]